MNIPKRDPESIKIMLEEIDKVVRKLTDSIEFTDEVDQDRELTISDNDNIYEAIARRDIVNALLAQKEKLEELKFSQYVFKSNGLLAPDAVY